MLGLLGVWIMASGPFLFVNIWGVLLLLSSLVLAVDPNRVVRHLDSRSHGSVVTGSISPDDNRDGMQRFHQNPRS